MNNLGLHALNYTKVNPFTDYLNFYCHFLLFLFTIFWLNDEHVNGVATGLPEQCCMDRCTMVLITYCTAFDVGISVKIVTYQRDV